MDDELPRETLRALSAVLIVIFETARDGTRRAIERMRPLVTPPDGLRVTGRLGALYTGVVIIERSAVIAGIVIEIGREGSDGSSGRDEPPRPASTHGFPSSSGPSRLGSPYSQSTSWRSDSLAKRFDDDEEDDRDGRLPGWAEDSREDRWRR